MLGEDVYGGVPFPLLPVATGYPAGGYHISLKTVLSGGGRKKSS
jgi:hypothetical protein